MDRSLEKALALWIGELEFRRAADAFRCRVSVGRLMQELKERDRYTFEHSVRTWHLMERLGDKLGLFRSTSRESIRWGCLLHDIGKLRIPRDILMKPAGLSEEEFRMIKTHCVQGVDLLREFCPDEVVLQMVIGHHERSNGSGYPYGLIEAELPKFVSALAVCDCFDALTSDRPYRHALSVDQALAILAGDAACGKLNSACVAALAMVVRPGVRRRSFARCG